MKVRLVNLISLSLFELNSYFGGCCSELSRSQYSLLDPVFLDELEALLNFGLLELDRADLLVVDLILARFLELFDLKSLRNGVQKKIDDKVFASERGSSERL